MWKRRLLLLSLAILLLLPGAGWAQKYVPDPEVLSKIKTATQEVTLVGRIGYAVRHGGYYLKNNPRYKFGDKVILNQNFQVLKALARSGRQVTIRGRVDPTDFRASHILIQSLDGRPYTGRQAPLVPLY